MAWKADDRARLKASPGGSGDGPTRPGSGPLPGTAVQAGGEVAIAKGSYFRLSLFEACFFFKVEFRFCIYFISADLTSGF